MRHLLYVEREDGTWYYIEVEGNVTRAELRQLGEALSRNEEYTEVCDKRRKR